MCFSILAFANILLSKHKRYTGDNKTTLESKVSFFKDGKLHGFEKLKIPGAGIFPWSQNVVTLEPPDISECDIENYNLGELYTQLQFDFSKYLFKSAIKIFD